MVSLCQCYLFLSSILLSSVVGICQTLQGCRTCRKFIFSCLKLCLFFIKSCLSFAKGCCFFLCVSIKVFNCSVSFFQFWFSSCKGCLFFRKVILSSCQLACSRFKSCKFWLSILKLKSCWLRSRFLASQVTLSLIVSLLSSFISCFCSSKICIWRWLRLVTYIWVSNLSCVKATIRSDRIFIDIVYVNVKGTGNNTDVCSNVRLTTICCKSRDRTSMVPLITVKHEVKHSFIDIFLNVVKGKWSCQTLPCIKVFTNTYTIKWLTSTVKGGTIMSLMGNSFPTPVICYITVWNTVSRKNTTFWNRCLSCTKGCTNLVNQTWSIQWQICNLSFTKVIQITNFNIFIRFIILITIVTTITFINVLQDLFSLSFFCCGRCFRLMNLKSIDILLWHWEFLTNISCWSCWRFCFFLSCFSGCKSCCLFISYCLSSLISCFSLVCCILVCSQLPFFSWNSSSFFFISCLSGCQFFLSFFLSCCCSIKSWLCFSLVWSCLRSARTIKGCFSGIYWFLSISNFTSLSIDISLICINDSLLFVCCIFSSFFCWLSCFDCWLSFLSCIFSSSYLTLSGSNSFWTCFIGCCLCLLQVSICCR